MTKPYPPTPPQEYLDDYGTPEMKQIGKDLIEKEKEVCGLGWVRGEGGGGTEEKEVCGLGGWVG